MGEHDAIILEEPREPDFAAMLSGDLEVEAYLEDKDSEFPEFSARQLTAVRMLHRASKAVLQVEPYLERLLEIHHHLVQGLNRSEVEARSGLKVVYDAESQAGRALLTFYASAHHAPFPRVVAAVQEFARADAARFRLRDILRAQAVAPLAGQYARIYLEAGYIHLYLVKALKTALAGQARVKPVFLMAPQARAAIRLPRPLGPGDLLTLHYIFGSALPRETEDLLAARSLIYIQLLAKQEMAPSAAEPYPHLLNEVRAWGLTAQLSYQDCASLYPEVRQASPLAALEIVRHYHPKH